MTLKELAVAIAVAGVLVSPLPASSVQDMLEKGLYAEKTLGDLDEAIGIYRRIVEEHRSERPYVAQAQFRLAQCYLQKGQTDRAASLLRDLVRHFPDQQDLATQAGRKLSEIAPTALSERPIVLKTTPKPMDETVDPGLEKITVTFDRPMKPGSYSWTGGGDTFPKTAGKPGYDASRTTNTLPVNLEPGKVYWVGINSPSHRNFVSAEGKPAARYVILFATARADGEATPIPAEMRTRAEAINRAVKDRAAAESLASEAWKVWRKRGYDKAEEMFASAVKLDPTYANAWNGLGWSRFNQGKPAQAEQAFERCLELDDDHPAALNGMGWIARQRDNTDQAVEYWKQAVDADPTATAALNGLATTYMEQKEYAKAIDVLEQWQKVDPGNERVKSMLSRARGKAGVETPKTLEVQPAPWADGERLEYALEGQAGGSFGRLFYSADLLRSKPDALWRVESRMLATASDLLQYTRVDAARDTFHPRYGRTKNDRVGDAHVDYQDGKVEWTLLKGGEKTTKTVDVPSRIFDNEQALFLIRRLPLEEDYKASFPLFAPQSGMVLECRIEVIGKETVTVPAGEFRCHKVRLEVYVNGARGLRHEVSFSADEHRYPVVYDSRAVLLKLAETDVRKEPSPRQIADKELGISLKLPARWETYDEPQPGPYRKQLYLLPPKMGLWAGLFANVLPTAEDLTAREVAKMDVKKLKGFFTGYKVRQGSWEELKVAGRPAVRYAADYSDKGKAKVEYRTYILDDSKVYWFVFRMDKDDLAERKAELDELVSTLSIK